MQTQPRFAVSGSSSVSADEREAVVIRELARGHELTEQLRAEALSALRGQGQAEATAALILQEMSRAFTVCLSIMSSPDRAPPPEMPEPSAGRNRGDSIPRKEKLTSSPHFDGHQWRKYGQKRITNTNFPRCYYKCIYHRERNCPVTKQVQQRSNGDPPMYAVTYVNEHTCDTPAWEPEAVVYGATNPLLDLSSGLTRQPDARALLDERGIKEEHERQVLVSSLACVLGGQSPPGSSGGGDVALVQEPQGRTRDAPAVSVAGAPELPPLDADDGLDVMDYDVTGALCFGDSYGLPVHDLPF
ncbi:transcription factor WRKY45-2-like [Phragmites australis]|uniref:transcription factor WRKY45-2-like n=1 Tax=Phragmites australis TaxID=29695 RepID=UPI002D78C233|nr:transcription factor WRKY45-2-like [Phragmites australis]